jgi:hypothetical protein
MSKNLTDSCCKKILSKMECDSRGFKDLMDRYKAISKQIKSLKSMKMLSLKEINLLRDLVHSHQGMTFDIVRRFRSYRLYLLRKGQKNLTT